MTETTKELLPCGCCERPTDTATLATNKGVCCFCYKSFTTAHRKIRAVDKHAPQERRSEHSPHVRMIWEPDIGCVAEYHEAESDATQALEALEAAPPEAVEMAADVIAALLAWTWGRSCDFRSATLRLAILTQRLRPELVDNLSLAEISRRLNYTKANASKISTQLADALKFKFSGQRSANSRQNMRLARLARLGRGTNL